MDEDMKRADPLAGPKSIGDTTEAPQAVIVHPTVDHEARP
jgi:hypothetical protein